MEKLIDLSDLAGTYSVDQAKELVKIMYARIAEAKKIERVNTPETSFLDAGFSERTQNLLKRAIYNDCSKDCSLLTVASFRKRELLRIRGCGVGVLKEIEEVLWTAKLLLLV